MNVRLLRAKLHKALSRVIRIFLKDSVAPIFSGRALLQLMAYPFFIFFVFLSRGVIGVGQELASSQLAAKSLIYALPLFLGFNLIRAILIVLFQPDEEGRWYGTKFGYHSPKKLITRHVTDGDNGKKVQFVIRDAAREGSAELRIDVDGFENRLTKAIVYCSFTMQKGITIPFQVIQPGSSTMLHRVPRDRTFYLETHIPNSNSAVVSVSLVWYSVL